MKIYKLSTLGNQEGCRVSYHSSKKKAGSEGARMQKDDPEEITSYDVYPIDFTPTKKGILQMLNTYTPEHDNG